MTTRVRSGTVPKTRFDLFARVQQIVMDEPPNIPLADLDELPLPIVKDSRLVPVPDWFMIAGS